MTTPARANRIAVIGGGLVGLSIAWLLQRRGYPVLLIDGQAVGGGALPSDQQQGSGSAAALGVLMAGVFQRSRGRAWRLRQRSQLLWRQWRQELSERGRPLPWREGLLLLAASERELRHHLELRHDPHRPPGSLKLLDRGDLDQLWPQPPAAALGGLLSVHDGQLDPLDALKVLRADALEAGLEIVGGWVEALERQGSGWRLRMAGGDSLEADWAVISAGLGSSALIPADLLPSIPPLQPVLGQALELELLAADCAPEGERRGCNWPGALVWKGINLIQRPAHGLGSGSPQPAAGLRLWLGATLEPGQEAGAEALERLRGLEGDAPDWLLRSREIRHWQGLRARPEGRPAPLLLDLGQGLLLASGHYRNGVLLAPASAEWVLERVEGISEVGMTDESGRIH